MKNLKDVGLNEYAVAQRRHIAIIGKFNKKDTNAETVPYSDAVKLQRKLKLYAVPKFIEINDKRWFTQKLVTANNLSDEDAGNAVEVQFDGVLGDALTSGGKSPAAIGGKLFGQLLSDLDKLMPFTHPSFDTLLIETFMEFTQASGGTTKYGSQMLRNLIGAPEVRERFLAYLRSDSTRREKYHKSFCKAAEGKARELGMAAPNEICDRASEFVEELNAESRESRETLGKIVADENRYKELKESIHKNFPPKHQPDPTTTLDAHLHHLFVKFHDARAAVEGIVNCEPILTLMISWLFTKLGEGERSGKGSKQIWENFYRNAGPVVGDETLKAIHDKFKKHLDTLKGELSRKEMGAEERRTIQAMIAFLADHAIEEHFRAYLQRDVFSAHELMDAIVHMQDKLMLGYVPGMREARAEIKKKIDGMREIFSEYAKKRMEEGLNVKDLLAMYETGRTKDPTFAECMEELLEGAGGRTGSELAEWFERELGSVEGRATAGLIEKLIEEKRDEASDYLVPARRLYGDGLRKVYAGGEGHDGVGQAPPGGSVNREAVKHAPKSDEHQEDRSRNQDQSSTVSDTRRAVLGARGDASGTEANTDEHDESPDKTPETSANSDVNRSADKEEEPQTGAEEGGVIGTEEELRTSEQRENAAVWIDKVRRQLIDKLVTSTELGEEPALCRAVLLGEIVLAADPYSSPLNRPDRSLLVHFILRMVEKLGADPNTDRERLLKPEEIDWRPNGPDKEFLGLPFLDMVEPRSDGKDGIEWLSRFAEGWDQGAKDIVDTVPQSIAEFKEVRTLVEELAKSGVDGHVTIINDTLEGHCGKAINDEGEQEPSKNWLISREFAPGKGPDSKPSPGIVYISTLAFVDEKERSLQKIHDALFKPPGPLARDDEDDERETHIQSLGEAFGDGCTWGMPVFIGKRLGPRTILNDKTRDKALPTISIDKDGGVSLVPGILWLAGVSTDLLNQTAEASLMKFVKEKGMEIGKRESFYRAWTKLLTTEDAIAEQVRSRICSLAMLARVRKPEEAPNFKTILDHALRDLGCTQHALEVALRELRSGNKILVGADDTPLPPSIQTLRGRDAEANLKIGGKEQVAGFFSRL